MATRKASVSTVAADETVGCVDRGLGMFISFLLPVVPGYRFRRIIISERLIGKNGSPGHFPTFAGSSATDGYARGVAKTLSPSSNDSFARSTGSREARWRSSHS